MPITVPSANAMPKPIAMFFSVAAKWVTSWSDVMIPHISSAMTPGGGRMKSWTRKVEVNCQTARKQT
jgi:hypothetical protein